MIGLIINIIAFICLMIAYILASFGKWKGDSYKFIGLNIIGSILLATYFAVFVNSYNAIIFILLNVIWSIGGAIQIIRKLRKHVY